MALKIKSKFIDATMFKQEIPTGAIDSVNTIFTLSFTPISNEQILVLLNGRQLILTYHYSLSENIITLTFAPDEGQIVHVTYIK